MGIVWGLARRALHAVSQRRWSGDEPEPGLTWGRLMTGDSLWSLYQKYRPFTGNDRILEIGPGYGRLLQTALDRQIPFRSYTGLELSQSRVERLRRVYDRENVQFIQGDIDSWADPLRFDVALCSSTFEHLYPDFRNGLRTVHRHLAPQGDVFIDFIANTQKKGLADWLLSLQRKFFYFEPSGTFVRIYPKDELSELFAVCGFSVRAIESCTLGLGQRGPVDRLVVVAKSAERSESACGLPPAVTS